MLMKKAYRILILLSFFSVSSFAQLSKVQQAYDCVQQGKLDSAKIYIEEGIKDPVAAADFQSWYIRGFIYKEIYKQKESTDIKSNARELGVESLMKAADLDKEKQQLASIQQNLKFLGSKYYNDAKKTMDSVNYKTSIWCFEKYLSIYKFVEVGFDEKAKSMEYFLSLSYYFQEVFEQNGSQNALALTKQFLNKSLEINPNSAMANKNMAVLYYNIGVNIIKKMDYDVDLEQLYVLQDEASKLFKQAEPFMSKAYQLSPKDKTIVEGMQGIYYQLNDTEKSNEFKKKLEALNAQ